MSAAQSMATVVISGLVFAACTDAELRTKADDSTSTPPAPSAAIVEPETIPSQVAAEIPAASELAPGTRLIMSGAAFGRPFDMFVGHDGLLYASYPGEQTVRAIDRDGNAATISLESVGLSRFPTRLGATSDGYWAVNAANTAIVFLDRQWSVVSKYDLYVPRRVGDLMGGRILGASPNYVLFQASASAFALALGSPGFEELPATMPPQMIPAASVERLPVWRIHLADGTIDTTVQLSMRNRMGALVGLDSLGNPTIAPFVQPFADHSLIAVDPRMSYVVVVDRAVDTRTRQFAVHRLDTNGDTLSTRLYPYTGVSLEPDWIEQHIHDEAASLAGDEESRAIARKALYRPDVLPPVTDAVVGSDGWLWLARERRPGSAGLDWEIRDASGEIRARIAANPTFTVRAVSGLSAWATERIADDQLNLWLVVAEGS